MTYITDCLTFLLNIIHITDATATDNTYITVLKPQCIDYKIKINTKLLLKNLLGCY